MQERQLSRNDGEMLPDYMYISIFLKLIIHVFLSTTVRDNMMPTYNSSLRNSIPKYIFRKFKLVQPWPWVDLDIFYAKVKFGRVGFCMRKSENDLFFGNGCSLCLSFAVGSFESNFYMKAFGCCRIKKNTNGLGHMSKMAALPIYGKKKL